MDVKVQAVHFKADQKLVEFCEKKVNKLDLFFDGIIGADIVLKLENDEEKENKVAEIRLSVPSNENLFAKKQARTFEEATDSAIDALRRQLKKYKEKLKAK